MVRDGTATPSMSNRYCSELRFLNTVNTSSLTPSKTASTKSHVRILRLLSLVPGRVGKYHIIVSELPHVKGFSTSGVAGNEYSVGSYRFTKDLTTEYCMYSTTGSNPCNFCRGGGK
eukprot:gb/GECG01001526.1/.p1 GENE.gb/GECG01001526.1/~~gb/GECG01001526.1/.p1  ORF type:complete len:116 (+),score=3.23 gb/GECG01001526.1/:1-348(+)